MDIPSVSLTLVQKRVSQNPFGQSMAMQDSLHETTFVPNSEDMALS